MVGLLEADEVLLASVVVHGGIRISSSSFWSFPVLLPDTEERTEDLPVSLV
jgi:hypothetical protein